MRLQGGNSHSFLATWRGSQACLTFLIMLVQSLFQGQKKKSGLQLKQLGNFTPASEEQCCLGVWRLSETRDHLSALLDRRNLNVLQNPRPGQELRAWPCKPLLMVFSQSTQETGKMSLSCCSLCPGFLARFLEGQKSILQCGINCVRICNFTVGNTAISDGE